MEKDKKEITAAFDLGSTTVVGALVDTATGQVLGKASRQNPQSKWGADILSRVRAVSEDAALLVSLQQSIIGAMNEILAELYASSGINEVGLITAAGNSVMEHIALNISPAPLGTVPYKPAFKEARYTDAGSLGIDALEGVNLYSFPLIGGFVGGDTVAVMLKLGLGSKKETSLTIDIGTNSEIVLSHGGVRYAASAAAGPAFEGGEISSGMGAAPGAIEGVRIEGDELTLDVIGGVPPVGLCGSGLVDAVGAFIRAGVIDRSGRIVGPDEVDTNISTRIKPGMPGTDGNAVLLYRGPKGELTLTQADIRAFQAAKGSIRAGVDIVLRKAGIKPEDLEEVYLAGAFGSNLKKEGLETTGIIDVCWHDRLRVVGNAALDGAVLAASSERARGEAEALAASVKYVSLSGSAHFERAFLENLNF